MQTKHIEFTELEKELSKAGKPALGYLAPEIGKVYVVAITRERCPACQEQEPKMDKLAAALKQKHGENIVFVRIHVKRPPDSEEESLRSKDMFGHYFYPTNLILLRTKDKGAIEYYRNISPQMSELSKNAEAAVKTAKMIKKEQG